jgi:chorismate mutase
MDVTREIGEYKKKNHVQILQLERWLEIVSTRSKWARELGLTKEFIDRYLEQLHQESIRTQTRVMNKPKDESTGE